MISLVDEDWTVGIDLPKLKCEPSDLYLMDEDRMVEIDLPK